MNEIRGRGLKRTNDYVEAIDQALYAAIPKAVWAAIALSLLSGGGDRWEQVERGVVHEWQMLALNGIVPQAPPARVLAAGGDA